MNDIAVKVENLGKKYVIGHQSRRDTARFNEYLSSVGRSIIRRLKNPLNPYDVSLELEDFWAVRNVSFELKKGDRLGIIGHNGSGKSTTLKMLSRITTPTEGRISMRGRIASLLEVGTGFHPERTGRENIFLNGSILGMTRSEIRSKFNEIVEFSGVEKFLDTPVKRYSSGMYVRLAFAVAAHLNPEILVVDEVLSVGDAEFQKKCIGKMQDISSDNGKTVLFVSHNMNAILSLCSKGIVLDRGQVLYYGDIREAVKRYIESRRKSPNASLENRPKPDWVDGRVRFTKCVLKNSDGAAVYSVSVGETAVFECEVDCMEEMNGEVLFIIDIYNSFNCHVAALNTRNLGYVSHLKKGKNIIRFTVTKIPFYPDQFSLDLYAEYYGSAMDFAKDALSFQTNPGAFHLSGRINEPYKSIFAVDYSVETE